MEYMNKQEKIKSLNYIMLLGIFLVLDVITTFWAFALGGVEQNPFLLWIGSVTALSIVEVVGVTHIIALIFLIFISRHIADKEKVSKLTKHLIFGVTLVYLLVILNNLIQLLLYYIR